MSGVFLARRGHRRPRDGYDAVATTRLPDWKQRLRDAVDEARTKNFKYGTFDCALFAADCMLAMTGVDYAASVRGYTKKSEARAIIQAAGGMRELITQLMGQEPVDRHHARLGDLVLADIPVAEDEEGRTIGICLGATCAFAGRKGIVFHPRDTVVRAWRIA
jgi:hypothetical protein